MKEIALLFLRLGFLGFGGPIAVVSMLEDETVTKRKWLSSEEFSKNFALIKVCPGPTATQLAIRLAAIRGGVWGGMVGGILFILPSTVLILASGLLLEGIVSDLKNTFVLGMQIASLAVIIQGAWRLGQGNVRKDYSAVIAVISFSVILIKPTVEPLLIVFFGFLGALLLWRQRSKFLGQLEMGSLLILGLVLGICLKASVLTFGTGLAIVPLLEADFVGKYHMVTHSQFLEALALGQILPGPILSAVTLLGFKIMSWQGAFVATLGAFAPGFFVSIGLVPWVQRKWGENVYMNRFYSFAVPAVVGSMFAVLLRLCQQSLNSTVALSIFISSLVLVFWRKTPAWFVIPLFGFISILISNIIKF